MASERLNAPASASGMALHVALTHALAGLAGAGALALLTVTPLSVPRSSVAIGIAALAAVLGLLVTWTLRRDVARAGRALARMARGEPAEQTRFWWPLGDLGARIATLEGELERRLEREHDAMSYRERALQQAMQAAAQEERSRLARELHDSIKQQIFSISVSAAAAQARLGGDSPGADGALADVRRSAQEAQVEMQALLQQLRPAPLERAGLEEALQVQCEALGYRTGAEVRLVADALPADDRLPAGAQESIFRIAQEALANVARHARARQVWVTLRTDAGAVMLEVRDDGQGFDPASATSGMGLENVRQRAEALGGTTALESVPGQGTTVRVRIPLAEPVPVAAAVGIPYDPVAEEVRERVEGAQQLAENGLSLAGLLILLGLPFWTVALAVAAGVAGFVRARLQRGHVSARLGQESATVARLRAREFELLILLAFFPGLGVWYLPVVQPSWAGGPRFDVLLGVSAVSGVATLLALGRWLRVRGRYFALLDTQRLRSALRASERACAGMTALWILIVALAVALGGFHPSLPPRAAGQWSDLAALGILALWPLGQAVDYAQTLRWKRRLAPMARPGHGAPNAEGDESTETHEDKRR